MTNNKQTALEWFAKKVMHLDWKFSNQKEKEKIIQQAKEMEKEQTINFADDWYFNGPLLGEGIDVKSTIEQHFNNTYGGGKQ